MPQIPEAALPQIAARRGWQTLRDALIAAALVAGLPVLIVTVQTADSWAAFVAGLGASSWWVVQAGAVAVATALLSWAQRRFIDHDGVEPRRAVED